MTKTMLPDKLEGKVISVLGVDYTLIFTEKGTNQKLLSSDCDGICDEFDKNIYINDDYLYDDIHNEFTNNSEVYMKQVLRHEITHAFLFESGLYANTNSCDAWSRNEEMLDWFAIQSPKIFKVFRQLAILD